MIYDAKNKQKLAAYAIGNGSLAVLWRNEDNSPANRKVALDEARMLADQINAKEKRSYRWYVSQCLCLSQAELSHT